MHEHIIIVGNIDEPAGLVRVGKFQPFKVLGKAGKGIGKGIGKVGKGIGKGLGKVKLPKIKLKGKGGGGKKLKPFKAVSKLLKPKGKGGGKKIKPFKAIGKLVKPKRPKGERKRIKFPKLKRKDSREPRERRERAPRERRERRERAPRERRERAPRERRARQAREGAARARDNVELARTAPVPISQDLAMMEARARLAEAEAERLRAQATLTEAGKKGRRTLRKEAKTALIRVRKGKRR